MKPGCIIILNGAPRSGKSSIARAIQKSFPGIWVNLGVDLHSRALPEALLPGIGLRPGGERPDLENQLPRLYGALYDAIAAHSRSGLNVVADFGHHEAHSRPLGILGDCARRLSGLPVLFVGVRCDIDTIMVRRRASAKGPVGYSAAAEGEPVPAPVLAWQEAVHAHGRYDVEVDTSALSPEAAAGIIAETLQRSRGRGNAFPMIAGNGRS